MQKVTVNKVNLLVKLTANRKQHRETFEQALEGYRQEVIERLDKACQDAKDGKKIVTYFQIDKPFDQTGDYDRAIKMLEWSLDDTHELTQEEFAQYVMDDWEWSSRTNITNTFYASKISK